jgi:hypothetical protein
MEPGPAANQIVTFLPPGSLLPSLVGQGARNDGQGWGVDGHPHVLGAFYEHGPQGRLSC